MRSGPADEVARDDVVPVPVQVVPGTVAGPRGSIKYRPEVLFTGSNAELTRTIV